MATKNNGKSGAAKSSGNDKMDQMSSAGKRGGSTSNKAGNNSGKAAGKDEEMPRKKNK